MYVDLTEIKFLKLFSLMFLRGVFDVFAWPKYHADQFWTDAVTAYATSLAVSW